ncbi:NAD(P)-binding domain-containing protein [Cupriavidus sp. H19C3]
MAGISEYRAVDFARMTEAAAWRPVVAGVDAVVNLVGMFRENAAATFDAVQHAAPAALAEACEAGRVRRVVQMSALGADDKAATAFLRTKRAADEALLARRLDAVVVQPSLVYGEDGASSALFRVLASMPCVALPRGGVDAVQPVHVDDVVAAIAALLRAPPGRYSGRRLVLAGPEPLPLRAYLAQLRAGMRVPGRLYVLPLGTRLARIMAGVAGRLPGSLVSRDAFDMLAQGNTAPDNAVSKLLRRPPRAPADFVAPAHADMLRTAAVLGWMAPLLRASVALLWIVTAAVSFGLYPVADSLALLARAGVPEVMRPPALYGAALLDLLLGVLTLWPHRPRWLWRAQMALIVGYTVIISLRLPEFWLHPYGPLTKNLPLLGLLWFLDRVERARWTTSR